MAFLIFRKEKGCPPSPWAVTCSSILLVWLVCMCVYPAVLCVYPAVLYVTCFLRWFHLSHRKNISAIPTPTTTKSSLILETLLRCQSYWSSKKKSCLEKDKANLSNEIQVHSSNASLDLTFFPSLVNPQHSEAHTASPPPTMSIHRLSHIFSPLI